MQTCKQIEVESMSAPRRGGGGRESGRQTVWLKAEINIIIMFVHDTHVHEKKE